MSHESTLPDFNQINAATIAEQLSSMLDKHQKQILELLKITPVTWESLMAPIAEIDNELHRFWAPFSHTNSVIESKERREAYNTCLPLLTEYGTERMQNEKLCSAIKSIKDSKQFINLTPAQQKSIDNELRDFHLSGVDLPKDKKSQFATLQKQLSQLSTKFSENLLDATHGFIIEIGDEKDLNGLPAEVKSLTAQYAAERNKSGWVLTLDAPCFFPAMKYLENRQLRTQLYTAFITRASDQGPNANQWDNTKIIKELIDNRLALAKLAGYSNYAEYALETRMANTPAEVLSFLTDLLEKSKPAALQEIKNLQEFAESLGHRNKLEAWDIAFYSEKLQQKSFSISDEEVRPYFQAEKTIDGMFNVIGKLFGIKLTEKQSANTWHEDVRLFAVHDKTNKLRGYLYTDLYARTHKRSGAWMDECQARQKLSNGTLQYPVAFLTCNFTPPVKNSPALLTHAEVQTAFHEFGHCLHHLLTKVDEAAVSGINGVPWDAVEFPSQFLENWCWDFSTLQQISAHVESGTSLPIELFDKMLAAKHFQSGMQMLRQLEFSLFDFKLHLETDPKNINEAQRILDEVRQNVSVVPVVPFNRFQNSFSHIFAGGYAAGYYSYKWAEVLSSDAFSLFEENGIFDNQTGNSFLENILERGGVEEPMKLFTHFRKRKPKIDALLRHLGLEDTKIKAE